MHRLLVGILLILLTICTASLLLAFMVGAALPNEEQISFTSARDGDNDIYLLDVARGLIFNLTHTPPPIGDRQAVWSPDGTQIAFVSDRDHGIDIYTQTVACPGWFSPCAARTTRLGSGVIGDWQAAWSPDGQHIAFTSGEFAHSVIVVVDSNGDNPTPLTTTNGEVVDANPSWSPDGLRLIFISNRDDLTDMDLYVMNADGSHPHRILASPHHQFWPNFSPDGRALIYGTFVQDQYTQLSLLNLETGQSTLLLDKRANDGAPAFSPDGQSLAFHASLQNGNMEIYTMRLDCIGDRAACTRRLTFNYSMDAYPQWRPG